ncbi:MAG: transposase, partial [Opitutus sp.]|nr:transposase [Opitutus sp.]
MPRFGAVELSQSPTAERTRLVQRLHELSRHYPRYGFRRIAVKLRAEGDKVGRKQVQKLRRAEGLRVPPPQRYVPRRGKSTGLPTQANHRGHGWTWDFIADATVHGGALRLLTVLDEHTK